MHYTYNVNKYSGIQVCLSSPATHSLDCQQVHYFVPSFLSTGLLTYVRWWKVRTYNIYKRTNNKLTESHNCGTSKKFTSLVADYNKLCTCCCYGS